MIVSAPQHLEDHQLHVGGTLIFSLQHSAHSVDKDHQLHVGGTLISAYTTRSQHLEDHQLHVGGTLVST